MPETDNNPKTHYIRDVISRCEDLEELKKTVFPILEDQKAQWAARIRKILDENHYSKTEFAAACGVSRVTVDKWCKGALPKSRETFLVIGMAAGYDAEQMDRLLQRCGRYPGLYSKSLEDCICRFVISKNHGKEAISQYQYIRKSIKEKLVREGAAGPGGLSTAEFDKQLSGVQTELELTHFIEENASSFSTAYHRFYSYVQACIEANYPMYSKSISDMAEGQEWSSSLKQCVSAIRQKKWYPTRNKIISLGMHLSMDRDQIDEMLELAHMEPLCAKNIFESVILFILEDASLNDMLDTQAENFDPDELCRYAREVLEQLDLPEIGAFLSELPESEDVWEDK